MYTHFNLIYLYIIIYIIMQMIINIIFLYFSLLNIILLLFFLYERSKIVKNAYQKIAFIFLSFFFFIEN